MNPKSKNSKNKSARKRAAAKAIAEAAAAVQDLADRTKYYGYPQAV